MDSQLLDLQPVASQAELVPASEPRSLYAGPFNPHEHVDPRLEAVSAELLNFWRGRTGGSDGPVAFLALQGELCQIQASHLGGIEAVRQQLSTAAQKGWPLIRFHTWLAWREANPEPLQLTDADFGEDDTSTGRPGFHRFCQRYRATYGQYVHDSEIGIVYRQHFTRLAAEHPIDDPRFQWIHRHNRTGRFDPSIPYQISRPEEWARDQLAEQRERELEEQRRPKPLVRERSLLQLRALTKNSKQLLQIRIEFDEKFPQYANPAGRYIGLPLQPSEWVEDEEVAA